MLCVSHRLVQFFATLWTEALQISLSMEFPSHHQLNQVVTGVGSHSLLQGIFLTQGSNLCLLHHRWIFYLWVIMTSIYEFWRETIHPITDSHLINSHLICISNKVLGQVFLIWNTKKQSHSPLTYSRLEPIYRTRLSWMKLMGLGHFENVSRYIAKSVYC